jgi:hypothetical protein
MCSCVEAFSTVRPCAILVVGVSGSLRIHGIGTASFVVKDSRGKEHIWKIHNCLLSHRSDGEEEFNLVSVSQILRTRTNMVSFGVDIKRLTLSSCWFQMRDCITLMSNPLVQMMKDLINASLSM